MKDRRSVDDLSVDELQRILSEKKSAAREARLAKYRRSGRALPTVPIGVTPTASTPPSAPARRSLIRRLFDFFLQETAFVDGSGRKTDQSEMRPFERPFDNRLPLLTRKQMFAVEPGLIPGFNQ